ncbi:hypothetical protein SAMN04488074_114155 [Lentzea albidocapillata subsp. violacea]|uniref:Uncharacterized protein n=1 Tax=Lentzea albidocapillata subsp. violacea TaxID=128104 RepID=A0A1G9NV44_9PSEU|nr:hypothetical protein [Lentzea albidocapillata]SDL90472.1 hypothetical protein SAMN04488074_114155 [Lentzea albidocapillata subsp. violacea]
MFSHHDAFAIAKYRQQEFEADAAARRLVKKDEKAEAEPERRRLRLFVRVRHA